MYTTLNHLADAESNTTSPWVPSLAVIITSAVVLAVAVENDS